MCIPSGSDARLCDLMIPDDFKISNEEIACRICRKKKAAYSDGLPIRSKTAILNKLEIHEEYCSGGGTSKGSKV